MKLTFHDLEQTLIATTSFFVAGFWKPASNIPYGVAFTHEKESIRLWANHYSAVSTIAFCLRAFRRPWPGAFIPNACYASLRRAV